MVKKIVMNWVIGAFMWAVGFLPCFAFSNAPGNPKSYLIQCMNSSWLLSQSVKTTCVEQSFGLYRTVTTETELLQLKSMAAAADVDFRFQAEHIIQRRSWVPNDALVSNQKYLDVIQMPKAWDMGRNAVNRWGDTLVVAILDDGLDTSHPDIKPNIWINRGEIPWNGKDDDQNGYVDDFYGWNGGDSNNRVFNNESVFYGHGTQVAGVLGAANNNQIGIAGVSYNTKLLPLHCYASKGVSSDLGVIRSMIYVFRQKKLWISSGKQKGINVVALNMSVGIDNTFPIETPLWCELFDSLKSVGIVCVSATTNAETNVELMGDIPSLCPSEALIVTSSTGLNKNWVKSGYGTVSIDLAAPGDEVYTSTPVQLSPNNPYVNESGTSFAAPMIAGTIAWLNSVVCKNYLMLQQSNPDSAVRLMKQWILTSVEKNASLTSKTATGGILQSYAAWVKMDEWCTKYEPTYSANEVFIGKPVLYPNPSAIGKFIVSMPFNAKIDVEVTDAMGREIWKGQVESNETVQLPNNIVAGVYQVRMTIGRHVFHTSIMINDGY